MRLSFDRPENRMGQMILKPGEYLLSYTRGFRTAVGNFRMHAGPFAVDLPKPGIFRLSFAPRLGSAQISGALDGCYALNFEGTDANLPVWGMAYQNDSKDYALSGLPAGTYRLSAATQRQSDNVFVRQIQATVKAGEKLTVDITPLVQGACSLRGVIAGRPGTYWTPTRTPHLTEPRWFVLIRTRGSGPVDKRNAYEALTMDSHYVVRGQNIAQEGVDRATYTISGIVPGKYTVTAIEHPWYQGLPIVRQQSKPLTLRSGQAATLDFDLGDPIVWRHDVNGVRPTGVNSELPPLDQIGHAAQTHRAEGRRLLMCFFDMDQRPSRNCLLELNRRAASLAAQGVTVLAVQTSQVNVDVLDEWARQNNITFPVGQIAAPEDRTRFAWGVEALPWLILTDERHIVVAQGSALTDVVDQLGTTRAGR
jgi:hypothetical protein